MSRVLCSKLIDIPLDALHEFHIGLRKIRSARRCRIVSVARSRGPGVEVAIRDKALGKQFRAYYLAVLQNEAARRLVRKHRSGDPGDEQRISDAQQDRRQNREAYRGAPD